jgi:maltooligosyltrehalose trehalohydrolase
LADTVRRSAGTDRHVHLILENERNQARHLRRGDLHRGANGAERCQPLSYTAQWNDDIHHALHVLITGEGDGYYCDYSERPIEQLGRCLSSGFAYQGEPSRHKKGELRGESTKGLPLAAFISFLQNHDQIGNRAFGERITKIADARAIRAAAAILMLAPAPPMLFMGEEFGAETPFLFFCDFKGELAAAVTAGRRGEFAHFSGFSDALSMERIPDPNAVTTFETSRLDWNSVAESRHQEWLGFHHQLLALRREHIVPRLSDGCRQTAEYEVHGDRGLGVRWKFPDNSELTLLANLGNDDGSGFDVPVAPLLYATDDVGEGAVRDGKLAAWSVAWFLQS